MLRSIFVQRVISVNLPTHKVISCTLRLLRRNCYLLCCYLIIRGIVFRFICNICTVRHIYNRKFTIFYPARIYCHFCLVFKSIKQPFYRIEIGIFYNTAFAIWLCAPICKSKACIRWLFGREFNQIFNSTCDSFFVLRKAFAALQI